MVVQKPMAAYIILLSKQAHGASARIASLVDTACQYAGQGVFFAAGPSQLVVKALKLLQWLQYNYLNQGHVWSSVHQYAVLPRNFLINIDLGDL